MERSKKSLAIALVAAAPFGLAGGLAFAAKSRTEAVPMVYEFVPVLYPSVEDMAADSDASFEVRVISTPVPVVDFGVDGKPDFEGDPGLQLELVEVEVLDVIAGDESLAGRTITIVQPPASSELEGSTSADRLELSQRYVVFATEVPANPGLGESGSVWVTPGSGQGVFTVAGGGDAVARVRGIFPESYEPTEKAEIPRDELDELAAASDQ